MPEKHGCPNPALNLITFIHKDQTRPFLQRTILSDQLVHLHRSCNGLNFLQWPEWSVLIILARMAQTFPSHKNKYPLF